MSDLPSHRPDRAARLTLPIFPLSTVVLFPGVDCPLHVFEPRYRQMTQAALGGDGLIGMVTVRPEHVGDMAGAPPVFPIGCLGRIVHSEELADGRINIVLHGTERFRIADEPAGPEDRLYREAVVDRLGEEQTEASEIGRLRERISGAFDRLVTAVAPERRDEIGPHLVADVDDALFVAVLVQVLNLPPVERQSLLEANGVGARLVALESILRFQLAGVGASDANGRSRVH
ncbi:MAG: LON peptidase substrate-binding domain-containing protein [Myxococcales bacterium]|nr:LON peptidase substrate-binding domain-containing protein [Myxococcales bacterium]